MADTFCWYGTNIPDNLINEIINEADDYNKDHNNNTLVDSEINVDDPYVYTDLRKSKNSWISTNSWLGGFLWHYVMKANRKNFLYDISHIENDEIQYTHYNEGDYYNWHTDQDIRVIEKPKELVRKLSFTLQLSDENEYTGGNLEFADFDDSKNKFIAPRTRGCLIVFDSRVPHRVCAVKSGLRKSLVGWVMGKRWR